MSSHPPGQLTAHTIAGETTLAPHPAAAPYTTPTRGRPFQPVRLPLPADMDADSLAAICQTVEVMFAIDFSGSMQADPLDVRYAAAQSLLNFLQRAGGGRVGVVHWNHLPHPRALAPLDVRKNRRELRDGLAGMPAQGGNDMAAALVRVRQLLPPSSPDGHQAAMVVTDGIEPITPAHAAAVAALPANSVHMLLIDHGHGCSPELETAWRALPLGSFTRLTLDDPYRLSWEVSDVLLRSCGITLPPLSGASTIWRRFRR